MDTPAIAVSNYFEVKDEKAFFEWCKTIPGLRCEKAPLTDDGLAHGVAVWSEDGFWTTMIVDKARKVFGIENIGAV